MPKTLMCDPGLLKKDLSGRVYIVTGVNSGTGLATSEQLLRQGAHVVGACRNVVCLSSVVHAGRGSQPVSIDFEDLHFESKP